MTALLSAVAAYGLATVAAKLLSCAQQRITPLLGFLLTGMLAGAALVATLLGSQPLEVAVAAGIFFAALCEFHLIIMTMVMTSISVSLISRIGDKTLTMKQIEQLCGEREMVKKRFARLKSQELIRPLAEGRFEISARGAVLYKFLGAVRNWFHKI